MESKGIFRENFNAMPDEEDVEQKTDNFEQFTSSDENTGASEMTIRNIGRTANLSAGITEKTEDDGGMSAVKADVDAINNESSNASELSDEEMISRVSERIKGNKELYSMTSSQKKFKFRVGEATCFDHDTDTVIFGTEQIKEWKLADNSYIVDFLLYHELGHMQELYTDPEGYRGLVDYCKTKPHGKQIFRLYNSCMDVFVNKNTANRVATYSKGSNFSEKIKNFYSEKTFPFDTVAEGVKDGSMPLSEQYSSYILLAGMGLGDEYEKILDPRVQGIINRGVRVGFEKYMSYPEFIRERLTPKTYERKRGKERSDTITKRKGLIDRKFLPIFLDLLEEDEERERQKQNEPQAESDSKGSNAGMNGDEQKMNDESGDEQKMNDESGDGQDSAEQDAGEREGAWTSHSKKGDEDAEREMEFWEDVLDDAAKTPKQREKERQLREALKDRQIDDETKRDFTERLNSPAVQKQIESLSELWRKIRKKSVEEKRQWDGYYKSGSRLDVDKVVNEWVNVEHNPSEAYIYKRREYIESEEFKPKQIKLDLLLDLSGSMDDDISSLKDFMIALSYSIIQFNVSNSIDRSRGEETIGDAGIRIIGFSDYAIPIYDKDKISIGDIAEAYQKINAYGGTNDYEALEMVKDGIADKQKQIRDEEIASIVIEVTDGVSENGDVYNQLSQIAEMGASVGEVRIGSNSSSLKDRFPNEMNSNENKLQIKDVAVDSIDDLTNAISKILENVLVEEEK